MAAIRHICSVLKPRIALMAFWGTDATWHKIFYKDVKAVRRKIRKWQWKIQMDDRLFLDVLRSYFNVLDRRSFEIIR